MHFNMLSQCSLRKELVEGMPQAILGCMQDPYALLDMLAMLPLLEAINVMICFAQLRNVFICDFIGALEKCHQQLFRLHRKAETRFKRDGFHSFNMLLQLKHKLISIKWDANLNFPKEQLAFIFGEQQVCALHREKAVTLESFNDLVNDIKLQCSSLVSKPTSVFFFHI